MTSTGSRPMNVGVIGCSFISTIYLQNCAANEHLNVLDIMHAIHDGSEQGQHINLGSNCSRPGPLPPLESATKR